MFSLIYTQDGEAYAYLLNVLAPEHCSPATLDTKDPTERAKLVLDHAERMDCKRYLTPKDIVEGSTNLNLAFVAQIFHERYYIYTSSVSLFLLNGEENFIFLVRKLAKSVCLFYRNGLSTDNKKISFAEMMTDDVQTSRDERCYRLWINSQGIATYVNNVFEDVRNGYVLHFLLHAIFHASCHY